MTWPEDVVANWGMFVDLASTFTRHQSVLRPSVLFRGQSNAGWGLQPSLVRALDGHASESEALEIESDLLKMFSEQALLHVPPNLVPAREQCFEWWMSMQHHWAPTRVLDWTLSPYVAAYFATVDNWSEDGAVWVVSPWLFGESARLAVGDSPLEPIATKKGAPNAIVATRPSLPVERMIAQQGHCTIPLNIFANHEEIIEAAANSEQIDGSEQFYSRMVIPKSLKPEFLLQLRRMNVSASALFPGLDGLGRSLMETGRLAPIFKG